MLILKTGGEKISKAEADKMAIAYDRKNPDKTKAVIFSADFVRSLLNDPQIDAVKLTFACSDTGEDTIVITTVNAKGQSIEHGDRGQLCPPYC